MVLLFNRFHKENEAKDNKQLAQGHPLEGKGAVVYTQEAWLPLTYKSLNCYDPWRHIIEASGGLMNGEPEAPGSPCTHVTVPLCRRS